MALSIPDHVNPIQWHQALAVSRQACADVFRDGGSPHDAVRPYRADMVKADDVTWDKAVSIIANALCARPMARAA